jgi:hypothetical protein
MRRLGIGLIAGVLGVVGLAGTASAHEHRGHGHAYHQGHGHRFSGGCYYGRHDCPVWGRRVWDSRCNRWQYWDSGLCVWYYWCPQDSCYYPITYCP